MLTILKLVTRLTMGMRRAIAQAVSRWLPIATARVRSRVWSSGICGGQIGAWAGFLRVVLRDSRTCDMSSRMKAKTTLYILLLDAT
jgi:hypothetical protein